MGSDRQVPDHVLRELGLDPASAGLDEVFNAFRRQHPLRMSERPGVIPAPRLNVKASWALVRRADGLVGVEIVTSQRLGPVAANNPDHLLEPAEYLTEPQAFRIMALGTVRGPWRWLNIQSAVPGITRAWMIDDYIDLSDRSQREMVELLCEQDVVPVVWVNEGLEIPWVIEPNDAPAWRMALEVTARVSAADWADEIAQLRWESSPSFRPGIPRPRPYKRRTVEPPAGDSLPFFARRSGAIPKTGTPELDGLALPAGSRKPSRGSAYWASNDPVANLDQLAPWLASKFPGTGLWPLLWRWPEEPDAYMSGGHHELDRIDQIDVQRLLTTSRGEPAQDSAELASAALAPAEPETAPAASVNPFPAWALTEPCRLLLVPCNRPADAPTALGGIGGEVPPPETSAVLRSWEQRFGAVLFEIAPALTRLSVTRPPTRADQARLLAGELHAIDPHVSELAGDIQHTTTALMTPARRIETSSSTPAIGADAWDIAW